MYIATLSNGFPRELSSDELITEPRPGEEYVNIQTGGPPVTLAPQQKVKLIGKFIHYERTLTLRKSGSFGGALRTCLRTIPTKFQFSSINILSMFLDLVLAT